MPVTNNSGVTRGILSSEALMLFQWLSTGRLALCLSPEMTALKPFLGFSSTAKPCSVKITLKSALYYQAPVRQTLLALSSSFIMSLSSVSIALFSLALSFSL